MKKTLLQELFLYRYRFKIGYLLLGFSFILILFLLPLIAPSGISQPEMDSAVHSFNLRLDNLGPKQIVNLPYHLVQKTTISLLGLNFYAIKLPSILFGLILGLLFVLLLNRWFKNNVALIASSFAVLSPGFLYLSGSGTPLIMLLFWPVLLLWLGSKIQNQKHSNPLFSFLFAISLVLSVFTPYLLYLLAAIFLFSISQPHLRFILKRLSKVHLSLIIIFVLISLSGFTFYLFIYPEIIDQLLSLSQFNAAIFLNNLKIAFRPFLSWNGRAEGLFLSPFIGLAPFTIAVSGFISTTKSLFASRNSIASFLLIFTIFISGLNPAAAILILLPLAILIAHGLRYLFDKWYRLFPENPYARIFILLPITSFLLIITISSLSYFIFGYRYNPAVTQSFNDDLSLLQPYLDPENHLIISPNQTNYAFLKILEQKGQIKISEASPKNPSSKLLSINKPLDFTGIKLERIITSSKSTDSDRIYLYSKQEF